MPYALSLGLKPIASVSEELMVDIRCIPDAPRDQLIMGSSRQYDDNIDPLNAQS
jgi:hypothetical protein